MKLGISRSDGISLRSKFEKIRRLKSAFLAAIVALLLIGALLIFVEYQFLWKTIVAIAGVGAVLGGFTGYWTSYQSVKKATVNRAANISATQIPDLSILVLPFINLTDDAQRAYIADALTTSISSDLSRIRDAFVIPATTAFAYKDKPLTIKQVGADAGVRFVLQGSVLSTGDKLRISTQLADCETGAQLWSETFDGELANLFSLQDQITARIGNSIGQEMVIVAARDSEKRKSSSTVAKLILRARALRLKPQSVSNLRQMAALDRDILALEPNNAIATADLAVALTLQGVNFLDDSDPAKEKLIVEGRDLAIKAKATDPANPDIYIALSVYAMMHNDYAGARRAAETRLFLEPKNPNSYNNLSEYYYCAGDPEKAIELAQQGLNLYPKGTDTLFGSLGRAYLMLGDDDAAIEWSLKAADTNTELFDHYAYLAMAYANKGDMVNARHNAMEYKRLAIGYEGIYAQKLQTGTPVAYLDYYHNRYVPQWKKAGLP